MTRPEVLATINDSDGQQTATLLMPDDGLLYVKMPDDMSGVLRVEFTLKGHKPDDYRGRTYALVQVEFEEGKSPWE